MRHLLTICLIPLFVLTAVAEVELRGTPDELSKHLNDVKVRRTVTLTGQSEIKVHADQALLTLAVATEDSKLVKALQANQSIREKVVKMLNDAGVGSDRINISRFSSTPDYGWFGKKPKAYKVENQVRVTIQNEKEFQKVGQIVDSFTEVEYRGIELEQSGKTALKKQAIEKAVDAVMEKKQLYEKRLGLELVPVNFTQEHVEAEKPHPETYGRDKELHMRAKRLANITMSVSEDEVEVTSFGDMTFRGTVSVEFAVYAK